MRVLVVGASGLIGRYVVARLLSAGCGVMGMARDIRAARRCAPRVDWLCGDLGASDAGQWAARLVGIDAVINCAGALQDGPRDDLEAVHVRGLVALATACVEAGVRRLVHVSAVGVETGPGAFSRTKARGEAVLAEFELDWVILRPGLVLAPVAYGGSALLRGLAAFPGVIPAIHVGSVVQVVSVEDVAAAAVVAFQPDAPSRLVATLVANEPTTLGELLLTLRGWLGFAPARVVSLPAPVGRISAAVADALARLGWRSPMRSAAMAQLAAGVRGAPDEGARRLGFTARSLDDILSNWPTGVQEQWYARLYFLKPIALAGLAGFWSTSGMVGLLARAEAVELLTRVGVNGFLANAVVFGGAVIDIALGIAVCFSSRAGFALKGMVTVTAAYCVGSTIWRPDLWSDPLGPMIKTLPAALLALVALAMIDDR